MSTVDLDIWSYNLDNHRSRKQVRREVEAILETGPAALAGVEAIGYHFRVPGYRLHVDRTPRRAARRAGRSWKSRANVAVWVRNDLAFHDVPDEKRWIDLDTTWPRTNVRAFGEHEPRSFEAVDVGRIPLFVVHQLPPHLGDLTTKGQQEGIDVLARRMKPYLRHDGSIRHRPRIAIGDWNRTVDDAGPGPGELADRLGGRPVGDKIDAAVIVGTADVSDVTYPRVVNGVRLLSDHGHAFHMTLTVNERWTQPLGQH